MRPAGERGQQERTASRFGIATDHALGRALRPSFARRPRDSFFFRAETLAHFASLLDERKRDGRFIGGDAYEHYGGRSLHERSHGEAFLATFSSRLGRGLWLLDDPRPPSRLSDSSRCSP